MLRAGMRTPRSRCTPPEIASPAAPSTTPGCTAGALHLRCTYAASPLHTVGTSFASLVHLCCMHCACISTAHSPFLTLCCASCCVSSCTAQHSRHLSCISPSSLLHLFCISPASLLHLSCISPALCSIPVITRESATVYARLFNGLLFPRGLADLNKSAAHSRPKPLFPRQTLLPPHHTHLANPRPTPRPAYSYQHIIAGRLSSSRQSTC